jgi:hypothetical protein
MREGSVFKWIGDWAAVMDCGGVEIVDYRVYRAGHPIKERP